VKFIIEVMGGLIAVSKQVEGGVHPSCCAYSCSAAGLMSCILWRVGQLSMCHQVATTCQYTDECGIDTELEQHFSVQSADTRERAVQQNVVCA